MDLEQIYNAMNQKLEARLQEQRQEIQYLRDEIARLPNPT
jgi:hypothetical protein